jgi:hypothetical protein
VNGRLREQRAWDALVLPELKRVAPKTREWISCEQGEKERERVATAFSKAAIGNPIYFDPMRVTKILDTQFGIDGILHVDVRWITVAKRLQFRSSTRGWNYETVTVRSDTLTGHATELDKLRSDRTVKPELFIQGYIDDRPKATAEWRAQRVIVADSRVVASCDAWEDLSNSGDGHGFRAYHVEDLRRTATANGLRQPIVMGCGYEPHTPRQDLGDRR